MGGLYSTLSTAAVHQDLPVPFGYRTKALFCDMQNKTHLHEAGVKRSETFSAWADVFH